MATRLDLTMDLDEPVEAVFDLMADCSNEPVWNPDALEVTRVDDGPVAAGAEWDGRYKGMGTMRIRLDEYERPKRLRFTTIGDKLDNALDVRLLVRRGVEDPRRRPRRDPA